jgi:transposase-like protein
MQPISYARHQFQRDHPARHWLYLRFTLSYRDVEELLPSGHRDLLRNGRRWVLKFGRCSPATCAGCDPGRRTVALDEM